MEDPYRINPWVYVKFLDKIPVAQYKQRSTLKIGQTNVHKVCDAPRLEWTHREGRVRPFIRYHRLTLIDSPDAIKPSVIKKTAASRSS